MKLSTLMTKSNIIVATNSSYCYSVCAQVGDLANSELPENSSYDVSKIFDI